MLRLIVVVVLGAFLAPSTFSQEKPEKKLVDLGKERYSQTCRVCHGFNMVTSGSNVFDLRKFPLDQYDRFFHSVREGKGLMPAFKNNLTEEQIKAIWAYISTRGQ
jgi:mono/diheme cytochrome c family protein